MNWLWTLIEEIFGGDKYAPPPTPPPSTAPANLLDTFCEGIKFREGANPANNNPGNCRYFAGGYLPIYGIVKESPGGFAMFPTYAQGWLYLENTVREKCHNHPTWTILQFFQDYAPASDGNDPVSYANQVATRCGVPVTFQISGLIL